MTDGSVVAAGLDDTCIDVATVADRVRYPSIHIPAVTHPL